MSQLKLQDCYLFQLKLKKWHQGESIPSTSDHQTRLLRLSHSVLGSSAGGSRITEQSNNTAARLTREERREENSWRARRTLRMWPVPDASLAWLCNFLRKELRMTEDFVNNEMSEVTIRKNKDMKVKIKDEIIVQFECKQIRDSVKAQAANLAGNELAGIRLEILDHLKKDFRALMNLTYDTKKKKKKEAFGWMKTIWAYAWTSKLIGRRIKPEQSIQINGCSSRRGGPAGFDTNELQSLVGSGNEEDDED